MTHKKKNKQTKQVVDQQRWEMFLSLVQSLFIEATGLVQNKANRLMTMSCTAVCIIQSTDVRLCLVFTQVDLPEPRSKK